MPLEHSSSSKAFKRNVGTLMRDVGKSPHIQTRKQALAIAYETQRRARAMGGGVAGFDIGGGVDPQQMLPPGMPPPPEAMPPMPLPGNTSAGVAPPQMGPPPPQGMNLAQAPMPGPQGQWAAGVAQNAAPPAMPQNGQPAPLGAAPQPAPGSPLMTKPMMANGGALELASGGFNMAKAPNLSPPWQTKAQDRRLHIGPVLSNVPGRTDNHRVKVPSGSYVLPAAHVSAMGDGNTIAGLAKAGMMFGGPFGTSAGRMGRGPGAPKPPRMRGLADGGTPEPEQDYGQPVDVDISGGEYVIPPEAIIDRYGDLDMGHRILDAWIMEAREKERELLKNLPPPAKA